MKVILHNEDNPEDNAMLQALYSRSSKSVLDHLEKLDKVGSGKFMEQFYLGYGHASIADCGFVTIYFEGISMLAAKAIEDNPLFNGQECSSRYIDFSQQEFYNPYAEGDPPHAVVAFVFDELRSFYTSQLEPMQQYLAERFPREAGGNPNAYEKAIRAQAFDVLRGFLPAGATTNVAWTTSLRKAHERLVLLMHHPLPEIQEMAFKAYAMLFEAYPHSFKKEYAELSAFEDRIVALKDLEGPDLFSYLSDSYNFYATTPYLNCNPWLTKAGDNLAVEIVGPDQPFELPKTLSNRPVKTLLPRHELAAHAPIILELTLDFGSFRDLQRHRGGYCSNPVLEIDRGFHPWYYDQLPDSAKPKADRLFKQISEASATVLKTAKSDPELQFNKLLLQYVTPMGVLVPVTLVYSLAQMIYVAELRSGKTVHPTLRAPAQAMATWLKDRGIKAYADMDESNWTERRGTQDIIKK